MTSPSRHSDLASLNTLGIPSTVDFLFTVTKPEQIGKIASFATEHKLPLFALGGGSNIVLGQSELHCVALQVKIPGREVLMQTESYTEVKVGAGENWDDLVGWSVEQGLRGIESLSLIPGTVGAAPVQNIGAYGQELAETLVSVEAYDLVTHTILRLDKAACRFSYRDSIFKHEGKHRYIVTAVTLRLTPAELAPSPTYATLQAELAQSGITEPTVSDIRDAVIAIRRRKLPDPAVTPTAGSFFHNPIITLEAFQRLQADRPEIPHWPSGDDKVKLSAGWLIEQCQLKGVVEAGVGMHDRQALALINPGHRPAQAVLAFSDKVAEAVEHTFGIRLTMEPELIRF